MTWKPIEDGAIFADGRPVPAPLGQQLVANYGATVRDRVYQYGARCWPQGDSRYTAPMVGCQLSTHPGVWLRIVTAFVAPKWVLQSPEDHVFRLHLRGGAIRGDVLFYVDSGGYRPLVNSETGAPSVRSPDNLLTCPAGTLLTPFDVPAETVLQRPVRTEYGRQFEVAVWMLSRVPGDPDSDACAINTVSSDGLLVDIDRPAGMGPVQDLIDSSGKGHAVVFFDDSGQPAWSFNPWGDTPGLHLIQQVQGGDAGPGGNRSRLVVWPAVTPQYADFINGAYAQIPTAEVTLLSYAFFTSINYEFVPRSLIPEP